MALPPIIANLPLLRVFKPSNSAKTDGPQTQTATATAAPAQDSVTLSAAARTLDQINTLTTQTRQILEQTPVALGLDPSFT